MLSLYVRGISYDSGIPFTGVGKGDVTLSFTKLDRAFGKLG